MSNISNRPPLGQAQKIILVLSALVLAVLLFIYQGEVKSKLPMEKLARQTLEPEVALANGRPTIFEFYADWCEACREMAPAMLSIEKEVDVVMLNVDNNRWQDLIEKYEVYGIPQLNFFDQNGKPSGRSLGVKSEEQVKQLIHLVLNNKPIPSSSLLGEISTLEVESLSSNSSQDNINPRSHS